MKLKHYTRKGKLGTEIYVTNTEEGGFTAYFLEFSNIITEGNTIKEAQQKLWNVVHDTLKYYTTNKKQEKECPECPKSPNGKHEYILAPDSFDNPYCKYCYKEL